MKKFDLIEKRIIEVMKNKEKELLSALRVFKSEIQKETIGTKNEITDELVENVAIRLSKQMRQSLDVAYDRKNEVLMNVAAEYMPKQMSEEDLVNFLAEVNPINKNMGEIMRIIKDKFGNSVDGRIASKAVKEWITKNV